MNDQYDRGLGYWTVAQKYLRLVEVVANEIVIQGNRHVIITRQEPFSSSEYDEETKWSDHSMGIPLLFNFYHGLELILKGFLIAKSIPVRRTHKLTELFASYHDEYGENDLYNELRKYIVLEHLPEIIESFLSNSGITIDDYYQSLKYSESTQGKTFDHYPLQYNEMEGAMFYASLSSDTGTILSQSVSLGNSLRTNN